jgi:hypothetical protein
MFVPFNLSQAIDVISDTYQVERLIRRFSVGWRKDNKEEEGIWGNGIHQSLFWI